MKTAIYAFAAALLAGPAIAGDGKHGDGHRDAMHADTDGDGRVSRAEATAAGSTKSGEWFDKLDLDKDGYVTQEETRKARETHRTEMKARFDEHFTTTDANKDGQLSLDEVQAGMPRMAERFSALDKDKNGFLSKEELSHGPRHKRAEPQS